MCMGLDQGSYDLVTGLSRVSVLTHTQVLLMRFYVCPSFKHSTLPQRAVQGVTALRKDLVQTLENAQHSIFQATNLHKHGLYDS
jgi:hypothetical protein